MDWFRTLTLINSIVLVVFLIVNVIALVVIVRILLSIKRLMAQMERIGNKAEAVTEFFQKAAGPAAVGKVVANVVEAFTKHRKK